MTAPIEAYVSILARDCVLKLKEEIKRGESGIVCARRGSYLVVVATGPIARELEDRLNEKLEPPRIRPQPYPDWEVEGSP